MESRFKYNPALFSKATGHNACLPVPHREISTDVQVSHLVNSHHQQQLYSNISKDFVKGIEFQDRPAIDYSSKMKGLYKDELDHGLEEYKNRQNQLKTEKQEFARHYLEKPVGVMRYVEKEEARRYDQMKKTLLKQKERGDRFIDGEKNKDMKIQSHIENNYDPQKMYHSQIIYDKQKKSMMEEMMKENSSLVGFKKEVKDNEKVWKHEKGIDQHVRAEEEAKASRLRGTLDAPTYWDQNNRQVRGYHSPNKRNSLILERQEEPYKIYRRHNPITNPIEYHIDNPYFVQKMQAKYQR